MAILIPDTPKECPHGERLVFDRFKRELDKDWVVLHSLGLVEHEKKLWGEIDFVVLSTKGIFVIEVKGGKVSCIDGKWKYEAYGKDPYFRSESPWTQAETAMAALRSSLRKLDPGLSEALLGYGVVMPHETFKAIGPEIEPAVLLDKREFGRNLGFYIGTLQRHWQQVYRTRHGRDPHPPTADEIGRLRQLLRPDVESAFSLGSYFNGLQLELVQMTEGQVKAARGIANNLRTVVKGKAGTGKTIVATRRASELSEAGLTVLYLCFNKMLASHVQKSIEELPKNKRFRVAHIHSLFDQTITAAGISEQLKQANVSNEELFGRVFPETFCDAAIMTEPEPFDVVIVDEAQDILTNQNLDALDLLLKNGLRTGRWHLFLDPLQNIYGKDSDSAHARLEEIGFAAYELYENCRNTKQVAVQTSIVSGIDMAMEGAISGPPCDCIFFRDRDDFLGKLERQIAKLLNKDVNPKDVIILSTRRREKSMLSGIWEIAGLPVVDLATDDGSSKCLHYATMQSFKGLERHVVLAIDMDHIGAKDMSMLHYAGLSRARFMLHAFIPESERKAYDAQAMEFGRRVASGDLE